MVTIKLQQGLHIATWKDMLDEQATWHEENHLKNFNFLTHPYWILSDDGKIEGFDEICNICEFLTIE